MNEEFLICYKSILPFSFSDVLKAKALVEEEGLSVSEACKKVNLSRSTFYKYKDKLFKVSSSYGRKSIIAVKASDKKGVLSAMLSKIYSFGGNVITINQAIPIKNSAYITLTVDLTELQGELSALITELKALENVKTASIIAVE